MRSYVLFWSKYKIWYKIKQNTIVNTLFEILKNLTYLHFKKFSKFETQQEFVESEK